MSAHVAGAIIQLNVMKSKNESGKTSDGLSGIFFAIENTLRGTNQGGSMELEITWGRVVRVWWSYFWRNLVAILAAMILGGIVGFVIGLTMGMLGASSATVQYVTAPLGGVIGLVLSVIPMKMILGKDFGEFRLLLISKTNSVN